MRKPLIWFPNRFDTNRAVQTQKMPARDWKFWILQVEELYIHEAKTKALISFTVSAKLICTFVFAYAECWFSPDAAHIMRFSIVEYSGTFSVSDSKLRGWGIRILHECQVWIDKSVPRVTFWHHEARRVMPNCDTRDRFVYPYLTRM